MTSQLIQKIHSLYDDRGYLPNDQVDPANSNITLKQLKQICSMPIWWTDKDLHLKMAQKHPDACCFHHYLGLQVKYGESKPVYPGLEKMLRDFMMHQANVVWKFRGMGATSEGEYFLPFQAIAGTTENIANSKIMIIVGPNINQAKEMIDSIRQKFRAKQGIEFKKNDYELYFPPPNNVHLRIFPSNEHINSIRSFKNVSWMWLDEFDFVNKRQIMNMIDAFEAYMLKSRARVIIVSTPNKPDHMLDTLARKYADHYHIQKYDVYTYGIPYCYTEAEVEKASHRRSFPREFLCKFLGAEGNVYLEGEIKDAFNLGLKRCVLDPRMNNYYPNNLEAKELEDVAVIQYLHPMYNVPFIEKTIGVDAAYGSSRFAITITGTIDDYCTVLYSKHFYRTDPITMRDHIKILSTIFRNNKIMIGGDAIEMVTLLKKEFHEQEPFNEYPNLTKFSQTDITSKKVIPISTSLKKPMLQHNHALHAARRCAIHPIFQDLRTAMESATTVGDEWNLDKEASTYDDLLDSYCYATLNHHYGPIQPNFSAGWV